MLTFKFITKNEVKTIAKENNDETYLITEKELEQYCSAGNCRYACLRYDGEIKSFMSEVTFLDACISAPDDWNENNGYTLQNICAMAAMLSAMCGLSEDSLLFYNENQKYVILICKDEKRENK